MRSESACDSWSTSVLGRSMLASPPILSITELLVRALSRCETSRSRLARTSRLNFSRSPSLTPIWVANSLSRDGNSGSSTFLIVTSKRAVLPASSLAL